jgi:hypothetical protein
VPREGFAASVRARGVFRSPRASRPSGDPDRTLLARRPGGRRAKKTRLERFCSVTDPLGTLRVPPALVRRSAPRRRPSPRSPARRTPEDAAWKSAATSSAASSRGSRASQPSVDRSLASHWWSSPSEVTSRRRPRHLTVPVLPRESDRPRADLPRHPRHRRRISGAGFALPHRLRRSRPSLLRELHEEPPRASSRVPSTASAS